MQFSVQIIYVQVHKIIIIVHYHACADAFSACHPLPKMSAETDSTFLSFCS